MAYDFVMTLLLLGIGLGIVLIGAILWKYLKTPKFDYVSVELNCKHCGDRTNGLKCPRYENKKISTKY